MVAGNTVHLHDTFIGERLIHSLSETNAHANTGIELMNDRSWFMRKPSITPKAFVKAAHPFLLFVTNINSRLCYNSIKIRESNHHRQADIMHTTVGLLVVVKKGHGNGVIHHLSMSHS